MDTLRSPLCPNEGTMVPSLFMIIIHTRNMENGVCTIPQGYLCKDEDDLWKQYDIQFKFAESKAGKDAMSMDRKDIYEGDIDENVLIDLGYVYNGSNDFVKFFIIKANKDCKYYDAIKSLECSEDSSDANNVAYDIYKHSDVYMEEYYWKKVIPSHGQEVEKTQNLVSSDERSTNMILKSKTFEHFCVLLVKTAFRYIVINDSDKLGSAITTFDKFDDAYFLYNDCVESHKKILDAFSNGERK